MQRRSYFTFILAAVFIVAGFVGANAQSSKFSGKVTIKKADGTTVPAAGVTIIPYRTDIDKGSVSSVKTNDKGEFTVIGVAPANKFALLISGPGIAPAIQPGLEPGMEDYPIEVSEGDGSTFTEEEVRSTIKSAADMTPEEREKRKKLVADNEAARKKAEDNYKVVNAALKAGDAAYKAKNYDEAVAKFDEGINADPDFAGSAPTLLNYKGVTLKELGFAAYQRSLKGDKAAEMATAKEKWDQAAKSFDRSLEVLASAKSTDPKDVELYADTKKKTLTNYVEVIRLAFLTKADDSMASTAGPIYKQYFEIEKDPAAKTKAQVVYSDMMFASGDMDSAVAGYRDVLKAQADNPDALWGLGLALYSNADLSDDKAMFQESANLLGKYLKSAPADHKYRDDATNLLASLKADKKITPQK